MTATVSPTHENHRDRPGPPRRTPVEPLPSERPEPVDHPRAGDDGAPALAATAVVSGLYTALPDPASPLREELRLDVDGRYPQQVASGSLARLNSRVDWMARLTPTAPDTYVGSIGYRDGSLTLLPYDRVSITVTPSEFAHLRQATVRFTGAAAAERTRTFTFSGAEFHPVELEYDTVEGADLVLEINTGDHPNRPAALPVEQLSIDTVYRRAGFAVTRSGGDSPIALTAAGPDALWSDMEMHDAMQVHWSRFVDRPQWSVWTLFAGQHEAVPEQGITPRNLGGIMFDQIGQAERQGTALFTGSFINEPVAGDPDAAAGVRRIKFWTAVHELGHTFNLAHSWEEALGTPWIPLVNEPTARTFMNYPFRVDGGSTAFFADFGYRFSDAELLFLRHAPEPFVEQGNAAWFDHHGFQEAAVSPEPALALAVRVHRETDHFEFLEPVVVELKLTNITSQPQLVGENVLGGGDGLTVIISRRGAAARQWVPYLRHCVKPDMKVLAPGESIYAPLAIASGLNGWDLAEPGRYRVQVALHHDGEDIVSNPLDLRVAPPRSYEEEFVAQDLFVDEVGRTVALGGTRRLDGANDTLRRIVDRFPGHRVADHARLALANPLSRPYKLLDPSASTIALLEPQPAAADALLTGALVDDPGRAADTLGHITFAAAARRHAAVLAESGDPVAAAKNLKVAERTLAGRGVLDSVIVKLAELRGAIGRQA